MFKENWRRDLTFFSAKPTAAPAKKTPAKKTPAKKEESSSEEEYSSDEEEEEVKKPVEKKGWFWFHLQWPNFLVTGF